jgi:nitrite reductase/ring-hydroxylating ferredoxin subunit
MEKFDARYGKIAEPIRAKGGRLLCPHRKVDLSNFPPDENGIVVCPLHGLRVRCANPSSGDAK